MTDTFFNRMTESEPVSRPRSCASISISASGGKKPLDVKARTVGGISWLAVEFACGTELSIHVDTHSQAMILANAFREAF